jgi:hypothetical protein
MFSLAREDSMTKVEIRKWIRVVLLGFALGLGGVVPGNMYPSRALAKVSADKPEKRKKDPPVTVPEPFGMGDLLIVLAVAAAGCWTLVRFNVLRASLDR